MPRAGKEEEPRWVQAREACMVIVGARAPTFQTVIVRDRHTRRLVEVPLAPIEAPPLDEGSEGVSYPFRRGERVMSDHPAVRQSPGSFIEAVDLVPTPGI
jgi:hypothetical protein